jgi:cytochrome c-type protein NapB
MRAASHRRATWIIGLALVTAAFSGYFMGLRQTRSALNMTTPISTVSADSLRRAASETNAVPRASSYASQDRLRDGPNARWTNTLTKLVQTQLEPVVTNSSTVDRDAALRERSARRAYNGAPPVIPHPIQQDSSAVCLACHGKGLAIKDRIASRVSHDHFANCTQCHVSSVGPRIPTQETELREPIADNLFVGTKDSLKGWRAWP